MHSLITAYSFISYQFTVPPQQHTGIVLENSGFTLEICVMIEQKTPLSSFMVSMSNDLIRHAHGLSLNEKRIIACCAAKIARYGYDGSVKLHAAEFAELFGLDLCNSYRFLKNASDSLFDAEIVSFGEEFEERERWIYKKGNYRRGTGMIELKISPDLLPKFTDHRANFTCYRLSQIAGIKCAYTFRLFELLLSWKSIGRMTISSDALRHALCIPDSYKINKIYKLIIDPSLPIIGESMCSTITYKEFKSGRSVTGWEFYIKPRQR